GSREDAFPGPLLARRQPGDARAARRRDRGRGDAHVLRRRDPRGRLPRAGRQHAGTVRDRRRDRGRLARLCAAAAAERDAMSTVATAAPPLLRRNWRKSREIVTPEGVPLTVELAEFSERAIALIVDLLICLGVAVVIALAFLFLAVKGMGGIV